MQKNKINQILIGHQIDDVYENFILRLLRGSGLKGLTSFDKVSKYKINDIAWEGNFVHNNDELVSKLGFEKGDIFEDEIFLIKFLCLILDVNNT